MYLPIGRQHGKMYLPTGRQHGKMYQPAGRQHGKMYLPTGKHGKIYLPSGKQHGKAYSPGGRQHGYGAIRSAGEMVSGRQITMLVNRLAVRPSAPTGIPCACKLIQFFHVIYRKQTNEYR